ncbi:preprotein translocase subunit SecG [Patescibacteria group bacterium]|nr:preprotein translocase subunit SecG [Patescibacteria group bacterium]
MRILLFFQFISGLGLIITILLHSAKGEGLGGIGGQARLFGTQKGLEEGLDKITTVLAVAFLCLSAIIGIVGFE